MTQCEFCKEYLWNEYMIARNSCSAGLCSSAYELAPEMGIELEDNPYFEREDD